MKQPLYLYIHTIGCQMNVYDSEKVARGLKPLGYETTSSLEKASLVIVNTCTIREKAQQKAFSFLGRLGEIKKKKPDLIVGVGGCVAQQEGKRILERLPHLDVVFGTHAISRLPDIIRRITLKKGPIVDINLTGADPEAGYDYLDLPSQEKSSRFVTIMQGCDNFCTYCVVPYVRGRETSRHPENIVEEIRRLADSGVREVTLLGQNVNSYGRKEGLCSFSDLLARVNGIKGLLRIRFTTSHPKDLSEDLIYAFKDLEKLCNHIHLPVQSGSNRILKRMNRNYTRELYLEKVERLRMVRPDIAITSDIIVGFPGEAQLDFEATLDMIKTVEYDGLFAFKYSDRPQAPSVRFRGKISEQEKKDRLQKVLCLQKDITTRKNRILVGSIESVLIDGLSKRHRRLDLQDACRNAQWTGRTSANKIVNFTPTEGRIPCDDIFTGKVVRVKIDKAFSHSLQGRLVVVEPTSIDVKGEESYAA